MKNFCQRLIESCEKHSQKIAMRVVGDEREIYTFGEMLEQIRSIAHRLSLENVGFGDRVVVIGENHPCWAIAYLATLYRGAICVPLDPHGEIETLTNFFENSKAKIAFLSADVVKKFSEIQERLGRSIPAVVWRAFGEDEESETDVEKNPKSKIQNLKSFDDWSKAGFPASFAEKEPPAGLDDNALLIYTSGTTGKPKGVPLTHGNICAELDAIDRVLEITEKENVLSLLPLFHAYLQIVNLWLASTKGAEVFYLKELSPDELSRAMKESRMTILASVPRLWYLFHKKIFDAVRDKPKAVQMLFRSMLRTNGFLRDTLNVNLGHLFFKQVHDSFGGNLRLAVSAGSRFDEKVAIDFHRLGFTIIQGYGLTETSGAATATYIDDNRVGSVGKPMYGTEVKIDSPDDEGVGEVLIRGGLVFKGYYENPEATREAFTGDGWFRSGDLGKFDRDGHLYIVGRAKDVIVLPSGKNVHPEDLEVHYLKSPLVAEMAILGVEDRSEGRAGAEKLAAVVVPDFEYLKHASIANSREAIRYDLDNLGREIPEYQRVREYIIRAEPLPRTATRKIKRFELKKEIETGQIAAGAGKEAKSWSFTAEDRELIDSPIGRAVASVIGSNARDAEVIHPGMNLEIDLGLDSLARAEVFAALEQAFQTEFEGDEAAQALTVGDVISLIEKRAGDVGRIQKIPADLNWGKIVREQSTGVPEVQYILRKRAVFPVFAFSVYKIFNLFCRVFMRLEVAGMENLKALLKEPPEGRTQNPATFLICPNHQSFLDPFVLCSNYSVDVFRRTFHVGASMFFRGRFMQWVARTLQVVPIDPDTQLMRAMKAGAEGLKNGMILNIYPEGERAYDGHLHEFKKGAAILATELDLPILPVALDGLQNVWARRSWRIRPAKVKIRIGEPFFPREVLSQQSAVSGERSAPPALADGSNAATDLSDEEKYVIITDHLKNEIEKMIDEMRK